MRMGEVAESFRAIETTNKRGEMTGILAALFRTAAKEDVDHIIYLMHGRLGAPYASPDFGVDERTIVTALAEATGLPATEIDSRYKAKGDLGLVGQELLPDQRDGLDLGEVYERLWRVATAMGGRSRKRKVALVRDLIGQAGGLEVRYILRILQGKLRLGVGDATIMDALSEAMVGDSRLRPTIERAYDFSSDLGLVGRTLVTAGPEALDRIGPRVDRPILVELAERLPSPQAIVRKLGRVIAEPKYDGLRLQLHQDNGRIRFFTRRLEDVTGMFPDLAKAATRQIMAEQVILDGEAVAFDPQTGQYHSFQTTVRRKRKHGIVEMETRLPLRYFAFDLLYLNGHAMTDRPLRDRRGELSKLLRWQPDDPIQPTESISTASPIVLDSYFQDMVRRGLEGIMVKRPNATYQAGQRNFNWVKLKKASRAGLRDTVDLVIVGYLVGKGKRARFGIGSLLGAAYDPEDDRYPTVTKIGSGLSDPEWIEMKRRLDEIRTGNRPQRVDSIIEPDVWVEPKYVVEVLAEEVTRSPKHPCCQVGHERGYALRFPRLVRFRWDKRPEDATTEREILELYHMQRTEAGPGPATADS